eukprot:3281322-Amphidinium_carterae.1
MTFNEKWEHTPTGTVEECETYNLNVKVGSCALEEPFPHTFTTMAKFTSLSMGLCRSGWAQPSATARALILCTA